jgi:GxxExxY protein
LAPGSSNPLMKNALHELFIASVSFERQVPLPVTYKSIQLDCGYRLDFLVEQTVVLEIKTVESLHPRFMKLSC